ncbi:MAG: glycosyltransferase [Chloroflexi bacterium]|nr:glycosyltransferase [Chloroflexota bacterium]
MRILYVASYYEPAYVYGGPVLSVSLLCKALADLGASVTVLTTNANGNQRLNVPIGQPVQVRNLQVYYYPVVNVLPPSFFYSPQLARACQEKMGQYDIAFLDTLWTHAMEPSISAGTHSSVPCIIPLHGQLLPWALKHKRWKKQLYFNLLEKNRLNKSAALHCASYFEQQSVQKLGFQVPTFVVPYGVNLDRFAELPSRGFLRQRFNISDSSSVLLFLGRLHQVKRPAIALEALAALERKDVHLIYAGPDEEGFESPLRSQARKLGCPERIHFTGLLSGDKVVRALVDSDLLIMSSAMESFGMSVIEAMVAGLPVVVSDAVEVGHWAAKAGAGCQVPGTPEAFAQAIQGLLSDPEKRANMGARGRELVQHKFDISATARQMLLQCQSIINTGAPLRET